MTEGEALRAWLVRYTPMSLSEAHAWVELGSSSGWTVQQTQRAAVGCNAQGITVHDLTGYIQRERRISGE
jgi:hypothetical protein